MSGNNCSNSCGETCARSDLSDAFQPQHKVSLFDFFRGERYYSQEEVDTIINLVELETERRVLERVANKAAQVANQPKPKPNQSQKPPAKKPAQKPGQSKSVKKPSR